MSAENSVGRRLFNLDLMFIENRAHWQAKSRLLFKYEITGVHFRCGNISLTFRISSLHRIDTLLYLLCYPQIPLVRTKVR